MSRRWCRPSTARWKRPVIQSAEIDAVAVTAGPGLAGPLMVGVAAAKAYALGLGVPIYGVHHLAAHVAVDTLNRGRCRPNASRCSSPAGTRRCSASAISRIRRSRCSARPSMMPRGRPTTRWPGCSGWAFPGGPEIDRAAAQGERQHRLPAWQGRRRHARLLLQRPEDGRRALDREPAAQRRAGAGRRRGGELPGSRG